VQGIVYDKDRAVVSEFNQLVVWTELDESTQDAPNLVKMLQWMELATVVRHE
jgi:hypothetical protein